MNTTPLRAPRERLRHPCAAALAALIVLALAVPARADRFVATGGVDAGNDCTLVGTPCATIAFAVSQATPGEVVSVSAGSFAEAVVVDKALTLRGAQAGIAVAGRTAGGPAETVIDARGLLAAVSVTSSDVVVEGLDLLGDGQTWAGVAIGANAALANITVRDNFVHGMALEDPSGAPTHFAHGVFASTGFPGARLQISGLVVQGNEIYGLGAADTVAGVGVYVQTAFGVAPGVGATVTGNEIRDLASRGGTVNVGTAVLIDSGSDDLFGVPTAPASGASVSGNTYANMTFGSTVFASNSSFDEPRTSFTGVGAFVIDVGRLTTINVPALGQHAVSSAIAGFADSDGYFSTIQSAVDASSPAAEVRPTAHVFAEAVILSRGVQLLGVRAGEDARTRDPLLGETTLPLGVRIRTDGGVIDGVTITNPGGTAVVADATAPIATVRNAIVATAVNGISLDRAQSAVVQQNLVSDIDEIAIAAGSDNLTPSLADDIVTLAVIQDNEIVDAAVGIGGYLRNATISRNLIRDHPGIDLGAGIAGQFRDSVIERNEVRNYDRGAGILLTGVANRPITRDSVFTCNQVSGSYFGVLVEPPQSSFAGIVLRSNSMSGNVIGILNYPALTLDATLNWWGCAGGPGTAGCDPVGVNVTFAPFLTVAPDCESCTTNLECDDNVLCNGAEVCDPDASVCVPGSPLSCDVGPADPDCNLAACQEIFGCVVTPVEDGTACDSSPTCSTDDQCVAGDCVAGSGAGDEDEDGICDLDDTCAFCGKPMEIEKARLIGDTGGARRNGRVVVKGSFVAPSGSDGEFDVSGPISLSVLDGGTLVVDAPFGPGECTSRRRIVTCKSADRRFNLRVKPFRPSDVTGKQVMSFTLRGLDIGPTFAAPITVRLRHGDGVLRTGSKASCEARPNLLRCF